MPETRLTYLLHRHFDNKISNEEKDELMWLLANPDNQEDVLSVMNHKWADYSYEKPVFTSEESDSILSAVLENQSQSKPRRIFDYRKWIYAAAAVVLLFVSISIVLFRNNKPVDEINQVVEIPKTIIKEKPLYKNDVKPGGNKAILTLADGTKIVLDEASDGALTRQGNTTVIKMDKGQLAYNPQNVTKMASKAIFYNTLTTPHGGEYRVNLPDGTLVWLNASTSLRFPTAFEGNERKVEVIGEAYFEVVKNSEMPFIVKAGNSEIKVLGTHFNVTAYGDDKLVKTTLLEGSVEVSLANLPKTETANTAITLEPGQQSLLDKDNSLKVIETNVKDAVAWKNGYFAFRDENIESIMLKISRWYDVKVVYEIDHEDLNFTGNFSRKKNVSDILTMLELTEGIHFKIENKTITILP